MQAVVCQNSQLRVVDLPEPEPGPGQVLLEVVRCGICGSDIHLKEHCSHMKALLHRSGAVDQLPSYDEPIVFGHELCCEVLDFGPGCARKIKPGTRVVAQPMLRVGSEVHNPGLSTAVSGGYAERMILQEAALEPVPNGLGADLAVLTEPIAVAWHAVRRSEIMKRDVAVVIGCGPVGLATIAVLKARGVSVVVASDFSAGRRKLAQDCGADVVVDPAQTSPYADWEDYGFFMKNADLVEFALGTREKLNKAPLPWWHLWRIAETLGGPVPRPVIFECVGLPGVIQNIIDGAPLMSRIVVAGVCMQVDQFEPGLAVTKEIDLRFVINHSPLEYRDALRMIAHGKLNCTPMLTGKVGLEGVDNAFSVLQQADHHAKIIIDPRSEDTTPVAL